MQASHRFKPFDVVVVPFPYADRLFYRRPSVLGGGFFIWLGQPRSSAAQAGD